MPARPFSKLVGPDNDVDLICASLMSRGVADEDICVLVGDDASREMRAAMPSSRCSEAVNCGDHVLLYFSGNASRSRDLLNAVLPQDLLDQYAERLDLRHLERRSLRARGLADRGHALGRAGGSLPGPR